MTSSALPNFQLLFTNFFEILNIIWSTVNLSIFVPHKGQWGFPTLANSTKDLVRLLSEVLPPRFTAYEQMKLTFCGNGWREVTLILCDTTAVDRNLTVSVEVQTTGEQMTLQEELKLREREGVDE